MRGVLARLRAQIVREFGILQPAWGHGGDDLPGQPPARVPHADDDGGRGALRFDPAPKSDGKVVDETDGRVVYSAVPAARRESFQSINYFHCGSMDEPRQINVVSGEERDS